MIDPTWKVYFQFSKKELKGIIVLGLILFGSVMLSKLFPSVKNLPSNKDTIAEIKLFNFDPNQIDSLQAIKLGIPEKQVKSLLHYRAKGGFFKSRDDFAKLYGLPSAIFLLLKPYIKIENNNNALKTYNNFKYLVKNNFATGNNNVFKGKYVDVNLKIDINTADEKEWVQKTKLPLPIIKHIISYQHYLGAFTTVGQISKVFGLTAATFEQIRPQLYVKPNQHPLMNAAAMGFNDWKKLGSFSDRQIWTILKLRKDNGGKIGWVDVVEACDLTQSEAQELKHKVRLSD